MNKKVESFKKKQLKDIPDVRPGDRVKVWEIVERNEEGKDRVTPFTGIVIARKHGKGVNSTISVQGEVQKVAVEKIFPLHSPNIQKIEILDSHKVRRSKLYYLRELRGKKARLKRK